MKHISRTIFAIVLALGMAIQTNAQEMNKVPTVKLNNGMEMPQLGVGTFLVKDDAAERVCHAIKVGFRLIDRHRATETRKRWAKAYAGAE